MWRFAVLIAATGEEAIALMEALETELHALVTDINLTADKLTGWDVAKHAGGLKPELPVIYMTGAAANQWAAHEVSKSVLQTKPFDPAQVVEAITRLLKDDFRAGIINLCRQADIATA